MLTSQDKVMKKIETLRATFYIFNGDPLTLFHGNRMLCFDTKGEMLKYLLDQMSPRRMDRDTEARR